MGRYTMFRNVASVFIVFAFDATTNVPKTGDAANITAYVSKDYGTVTVLGDTSATEFDATNAPGYYWFTAAQAETNADCLMVTAKSSTSNIKVLGAPAVIYTRPTTGWLAPATAGRTLVVDASGLADANMVKAGPTGSGTAQTARDLGASVLLSSGTGTGQLDFTSGVVKANPVQWLGGTIPAVNVTGVPLIDLKYTLGTISPATAGSVRADSVTGAVGSVTGLTASDVGAIKTNTDKLSFTVANQIDCNVLDWKSATAPAMTGDAYARIGAAGVGLTAVGLTGTQTFNNTGTWTGNIVGTLSTLTTYTGNTPQTGDNYARLGAPAGASISADIAAKPTAAQCATAVFTTQLTESYAALHAAPTLAQALFELRAFQSEKSVAGTTLTLKKVDGSTSAGTYTLNDSAAPTAITRAT